MDNNHVRTLLERLNDHCVAAIEEAAAFAATRGHYQVDIEHVAVKLLECGGGDFDRILNRFEVDLDPLWQCLLESLAARRAGNQGKPAFAPELFQWLERAWLSSSLHFDAAEIRSGALLDALIEMAPLLRGDIWRTFETVPREHLRRDFHRLAAGSVEESSAGISAGAGKSDAQADVAEGADSALGRFTIDITRRAAAGEIDPVLGRSQEIRMMLDILSRRRKNNPIVVGEPGVGKTALAEGLALCIVRGEVPAELRDVRLLTLDLGLLQAGAGVKGEFEKRLKAVIDEVKSAPRPIILFIDEAHTLIGAGGEAGLGDAANLFKPALARGELRTIAATTWSEYKKYFERDAALARRFQLVKVDEPAPEAAIAMLGGLKHLYQKHHDILITDAAIEAAVRLSARYITGRQLPDKAIDLLDTAAARIRMGQAAVPSAVDADREQITCLKERLQHLEQEADNGLPVDPQLLHSLRSECELRRQRLDESEQRWREQGEMVAQIRRERAQLQQSVAEKGKVRNLPQVSGRLEKLRTLQDGMPLVQAEVNAEAIAAVVADWTGVPVGRMLRDELTALMRLEDLLAQRVVGQQPAIAAMSEALRTAKAGLRAADAPLGVFLLAGPSGVGKTETARALAEQLFGGERFLVTINMSEYQEAHTVSQLKGSPPGYVGYGEGGVLTEAVRQRPYSVILLDEVEKAHPDVMNLFYQVFDRGFMRDGEGREVDFKNTVIVMTTNLGTTEILALCAPVREDDPEASPTSAKPGWQEPSCAVLREVLQPALLGHFAPALLARMQVIPFRALSAEALSAIVALKLDQVAQRLHSAHGIELRCAPEVLQHLAERCRQPAEGARFINALIEQRLLPGVSRALLGYMTEGDLPDILCLEVDEDGELSCLFADQAKDAAVCAGEPV